MRGKRHGGAGVAPSIVAILLALTACKRDGQRGPTHATERGDTDALLALAPAGARFAVVVSPRALGLVDDARARLRAVAPIDPAIASAMGYLDRYLAAEFGLPEGGGVEALGLTRARGLAWFGLTDDDVVAILPVADRARFAQALGGQVGSDGTDVLPFGERRLQCRETRGVYACADRLELLDRLGTGSLVGRPAMAGDRGDVEFLLLPTGTEGPTAVEVAATVALEPGGLIARARTRGGLPPEFTAMAGKPTRLKPGRASGFLALTLPDGLRDAVRGDTMAGAIVAALAGPITAVVPSGVADVDLRVPLRDAGPIRQLLDNCDRLPLPPTATLRRDGDACVATMTAPYQLTATARIEGDVLRISRARGAVPRATGPEPTALGRELADGAWHAVAWGRGSIVTMIPPGIEAAVTDDAEVEVERLGAQLRVRAYAYLTELGLGLRVERDGLAIVVGARTVFTNPAPVIDAMMGLIPRALTSAPVGDDLGALARAHAGSPLADDLAAGPAGLTMPVAGVGILAAVAIPPFLDYMNASKRSEAELNLNAIQKAALRAFAEDDAFPIGAVGPTPAAPCCESPDRRCPADPAAWSREPVWRALGFAVTRPSLYRYSYRGDGRSLVATAESDLDCDGVTAAFTLRGVVGPDGRPEFVLERPTNRD